MAKNQEVEMYAELLKKSREMEDLKKKINSNKKDAVPSVATPSLEVPNLPQAESRQSKSDYDVIKFQTSKDKEMVMFWNRQGQYFFPDMNSNKNSSRNLFGR